MTPVVLPTRAHPSLLDHDPLCSSPWHQVPSWLPLAAALLWTRTRATSFPAASPPWSSRACAPISMCSTVPIPDAPSPIPMACVAPLLGRPWPQRRALWCRPPSTPPGLRCVPLVVELAEPIPSPRSLLARRLVVLVLIALLSDDSLVTVTQHSLPSATSRRSPSVVDVLCSISSSPFASDIKPPHAPDASSPRSCVAIHVLCSCRQKNPKTVWRSKPSVDAPKCSAKGLNKDHHHLCGVLVNMERFQELWIKEKVKLSSMLARCSIKDFIRRLSTFSQALSRTYFG
jgi:hypothetical protein